MGVDAGRADDCRASLRPLSLRPSPVPPFFPPLCHLNASCWLVSRWHEIGGGASRCLCRHSWSRSRRFGPHLRRRGKRALPGREWWRQLDVATPTDELRHRAAPVVGCMRFRTLWLEKSPAQRTQRRAEKKRLRLD